jgi:ribosomal protein S11
MLKKKFKVRQFKKFFFGLDLKNKIANIYIRRTYTNVFVTLTDMKNNVIICITSGSADKSLTNRRKKRIAQAVEQIVIAMNYFFKLYEIKSLHVILKMKVKAHVYTLISKVLGLGLSILSLSSRRLIAHNGVKGRRLRRL